VFNNITNNELNGLAVKPPPQHTYIKHTPETLKKLETLKQLALLSFTEAENCLLKCVQHNDYIVNEDQHVNVIVSHLKKVLDPS
jgi:hypothetical protein